jgi:glucosamine kinase
MNSNISPTYYLGVDGGGTRCRARLQDTKGHTLGESEGGPANIRLGLDTAWAGIMTAIDGALAAAGLTREALPLTAAGLGLAGVVSPKDCVRTLEAAPKFHSIRAAADFHVACLGAFSGRDGGIQIAGTGSSSYAIVNGKGVPVGGFGFSLAEKGSAAALGRDAIQAALEAHDGLIPQTALTQAIMAHFGSPAAIVDWSDTARPGDYGALSPLVFEHAAQDDAVALRLVNQLAADIGRYIAHLIHIGAPKVCLVGGLAPHITPWLTTDIRAHLAAPKLDILDGALLLARQTDDAAIEHRADS